MKYVIVPVQAGYIKVVPQEYTLMRGEEFVDESELSEEDKGGGMFWGKPENGDTVKNEEGSSKVE